MPNQIEDYIHRIGRTGRAGKTGTAYSYFTPDQSSAFLLASFFEGPPADCSFLAELARDLVKILTDAKQVVPPQLQELTMYGGGGGGGALFSLVVVVEPSLTFFCFLSLA